MYNIIIKLYACGVCVFVCVRVVYSLLLLMAAMMRVSIEKKRPMEEITMTETLIMVLAGSSYSIQSQVGVQLLLSGRQWKLTEQLSEQFPITDSTFFSVCDR